MASSELVRKFRREIPEAHRVSLDNRIQWLWNQRFGTVETIWKEGIDTLDKTACTVVMQAVLSADLNSITLLFQRLEGGAQLDEEEAERASEAIRV